MDGVAAPHPSGTPGESRDDRDAALSRRDRDILAFERQWWQFAGA